MKYQITAAIGKQEFRFVVRVPPGARELREARDRAAEILKTNLNKEIDKLDTFKCHQIDKEGQAADDPRQSDLPGTGPKSPRGSRRERVVKPSASRALVPAGQRGAPVKA